MSGGSAAAPPAAVVALAEERAQARAARDYRRGDLLRAQISEAGWLVRDGADGWTLAERPPYDVLASVADLPDRSGEPDARRCTVGVLVEGWADDVRTCVAALMEHAPADVVVVLLDNGSDAGDAVHELSAAYPGRVEELHVERPAGWSEAGTALLRADVAAVHVLLDPSTVLEGDALTPVLECFADPSVVGAGWRGAAVQDGWTAFRGRRPGRGRGPARLPVRRPAQRGAHRPPAGEGALLPQRRPGVVLPAA